MRRFRTCLWFCFVVLVSSSLIAPASGDEIAERAKKLHFSSIVLDTHDDTTQRFFSTDFDIAKRNADGSIRCSASTGTHRIASVPSPKRSAAF